MAGSTSKKNRTKSREQKKKALRRQSAQQARREKADFYFDDALYYLESGNHEKAEAFLKKSLKRNPDNRDALFELIRLGDSSQNDELIEKGLLQLYERNLLNNTPNENKMVLLLCQYLLDSGNFIRAGQICEDLLARRKTLNLENPKDFRERLNRVISYRNAMLELQENTPETRTESRPAKQKSKAGRSRGRTAESGTKAAGMQTAPSKSREPAEAAPAPPAAEKKSAPEIPITLEIGQKGIAEGFAGAEPTSKEHYDLVMDAVRLRFKETFDHLLCLSTLNGIASLEYQEETARKVLKTFRGRAMLADEVGMGKTIEAAIVVKEYLMRRMIRNVLVLAPTPLVSQWREELSSKFGLAFVSTDDRNFRASDESFWQQPFIVASINIAKSKKNFSAVSGRQWDMVVADEAHHFKNRNTLNWKLLNAMKKRFLLMLTATPVENNLMELYNLITLLKPGQLKTASAFKEEFMTRGDPTDPRNRTRLKSLLEQVMIRNTRAVSNVRIPPRFAETIRTDPSDPEAELYRRVSDLVRGINASNGSRRQATLKHLLAEAGSSPAALEKTISELAEKHDLTDHHHKEIQEILNLISSMEDTGKNRTVLHLIRSTDEKIIIFVKYRATLDHLSGLLTRKKVAHSLFHGQMPNARKDREIEKFKTENQVLLTTELGGEGRNLQFCRRMINYDLPWNPMRIEQRIGRIHRIGQEREVMIYNLCAAGTAEDYILDLLDRKINMFEMVIGEIDMIMGRMRGDKDFADTVYEIWVGGDSEESRKQAFDKLGTRLKRYKTGYEKTKSMDEKLFGENYEI